MFKEIKSKVDFPKMEEEVLQFWDEKKCFERSVSERSDENTFYFYDGPPFATGLPHYGHLLASTIKDVIPRYQTMYGIWRCFKCRKARYVLIPSVRQQNPKKVLQPRSSHSLQTD